MQIILRKRRFRIIIRRRTAILRIFHIHVFVQIIFLIQNRALPTHQQYCLPVIQKAHFIWSEKFPAGLLEIHRITSASSSGLPVGIGIQRFFSQKFGDILMSLFLIAAQI